MNNTMVREIHGAKIKPKLWGAKYVGAEITRANMVDVVLTDFLLILFDCKHKGTNGPKIFT